jgi:hypothetical protein
MTDQLIKQSIELLQNRTVEVEMTVPVYDREEYTRRFTGSITAGENTFLVEEMHGAMADIALTINYLSVIGVEITAGGPPYATITVHIHEED